MKTKFLCQKFPSLKIVLRPDTHVLREGIPYLIKGKRVQFYEGMLITEDEEVIERIRKSEKFGSAIIEITQEEENKLKRKAKIEKRAKELAEKELAEEEARNSKKE